jgi:hypothetical protein
VYVNPCYPTARSYASNRCTWQLNHRGNCTTGDRCSTTAHLERHSCSTSFAKSSLSFVNAATDLSNCLMRNRSSSESLKSDILTMMLLRRSICHLLLRRCTTGIYHEQLRQAGFSRRGLMRRSHDSKLSKVYGRLHGVQCTEKTLECRRGLMLLQIEPRT